MIEQENAQVGVAQAAGWRWVACPLCGCADHELVLEMRNRLFGIDEVACLRRCSCGLVLTNPQPTEEALARLYDAEEYYTHNDGRSLKERLRNLTRRWQLRGALARLRLRAERATQFRRFTSRFAPEHFALNRGMRLLDFGCGAGDVSSLGVGLGLTVVGVEPDDQASAAAGARGVRTVSSLELLPAGETFDRIIIRHVLEHVTQPLAVLGALGQRLAPAGRMLVAVPNVEAHQARVFGEHWIGYDVPRHLWHFSPQTLAATAERSGLAVVWMGTVEVRGFAEKSLENAPESKRAALRAAWWSAGEVERAGRGTEIVAVLRRADG